MNWTLTTFYKFLDIPDPAAMRPVLQDYCEKAEIFGTVLLAPEGINGTVAGQEAAIHDWILFLQHDCKLGEMDHKLSHTEGLKPFRRLKIRLKTEIVRLGRPDLHPHTRPAGRYVEPRDWNELISNPEVRVIDTRNDFECEVGSFVRAENPRTGCFSEFPSYVSSVLNPVRDTKVAMFCTGGIRCEKATALLLEQGFKEVFHLKGGILKYLEEVPESESLWQGECFVFDDRVTVDHRLRPGETECCRGCWNPLLPAEKTDPRFEEGVSCPRCFEQKTPEQLAGARERERQRLLAKQRAECPGPVHP